MRSVIVLCTGNICRSPMAEALLRHKLAECQADGAQTRVASAGLGALVGHGADAHAMRLMAGLGIDISDHRARSFSGAMGIQHDLILTMSVAQRQHVESQWPLLQGRTFLLGYFDEQEIDDPYRKNEGAFRDALDGIQRGVEQWLPLIAR